MKKIIIPALIMSFTFGVIPMVFAQTTNTTCPNGGTVGPQGACNLGYTPLEPLPGEDTSQLTNPAYLPQLINIAFQILFTLGALTAVVMLTWGGVEYMLTDVVAIKSQARKRAANALWGMALLAGAWLILHTINPNLLTFTLNPCPPGSTGCTIASTGVNNATGNTTVAQGGDCSSTPCASGLYCAQESNGYGTVGSVCISTSNSSAAASCNSSGGTWTTSVVGNQYCWLSNATTQSACSAAGGTWQGNAFTTFALQAYCYK